MGVMTLNVSNVTTTVYPSNGTGGTYTTICGSSNAADEAFTATTGSCSAWATAAPNAGTWSAGDMVVTSDGYVGKFVSGTATEVTVDRWIHVASGTVGVPAALSDIKGFNTGGLTSPLLGSRLTTISRIILTQGPAAASTIVLTDGFGATLQTFAVTATTPQVIEFTTPQNPGLVVKGLFGITCGAANMGVTVVFSA